MPNREQLNILKQGVEVWNEWREENLNVKVDLSNADLTDCQLKGGNFANAILINAELGFSDLRNVDLRGANLINAGLAFTIMTGATLTDATLANADLTSAALTGANLAGAVLNDADLTRADLKSTILTDTNLMRATLIKTILNHAILTGAKLYGTICNDWMIDGVICDFVFWDEAGKKRTPENKDFRTDEFEKTYRGNQRDNEVRINNVLGRIGSLKGILFELVIDKLLHRIFPSTNVERNRILQEGNGKKKKRREYDFIVTDASRHEIVIIEAKGYYQQKQIPLGDKDTPESVKWFFENRFTFAKRVLPNPDNYTIKACYITSANFAKDAELFLEEQKNTRLKPSNIDVFYNRKKLEQLLQSQGLNQEIKILNEYFRRNDNYIMGGV